MKPGSAKYHTPKTTRHEYKIDFKNYPIHSFYNQPSTTMSLKYLRTNAKTLFAKSVIVSSVIGTSVGTSIGLYNSYVMAEKQEISLPDKIAGTIGGGIDGAFRGAYYGFYPFHLFIGLPLYFVMKYDAIRYRQMMDDYKKKDKDEEATKTKP
jgi:hypothetical protein